MAAPMRNTVPVVGLQFCAPYPVNLTITKKALSLSQGDFAVTDVNGNVLFKVKGKVLSLHHRCVLLDAAGNPILSMQQKLMSMHQRWQVFRGDSSDPKDLMFSMKRSSFFQFKAQFSVYFAANTKEDVCDFKIRGKYFARSCTVYLGDSNIIIAQMSRQYTVKNIVLGKDTFGVTVYPDIDHAFIVALVVILDEIYSE